MKIRALNIFGNVTSTRETDEITGYSYLARKGALIIAQRVKEDTTFECLTSENGNWLITRPRVKKDTDYKSQNHNRCYEKVFSKRIKTLLKL